MGSVARLSQDYVWSSEYILYDFKTNWVHPVAVSSGLLGFSNILLTTAMMNEDKTYGEKLQEIIIVNVLYENFSNPVLGILGITLSGEYSRNLQLHVWWY